MFFSFLGTTEIVVILAIALLVFGPTKLPEIGRQIGSAMREMRRMSNDVQRALELDDYPRYASNDTYSDSSRTYDYSTETSAWSGESEKATENGEATASPYGTVPSGGDYRAEDYSENGDQAEYVSADPDNVDRAAMDDLPAVSDSGEPARATETSGTSGAPDRREEA